MIKQKPAPLVHAGAGFGGLCRDGLQSSPGLQRKCTIAGAALQPFATQGRSYRIAQGPVRREQASSLFLALRQEPVQHQGTDATGRHPDSSTLRTAAGICARNSGTCATPRPSANDTQ